MSAKNRIIPIFIPHLGCPHSCVFCDQRRISGSLSPARPEDVTRGVEEGLARLSEGSRPQLAFYGGSFTAIAPEAQEALLSAAQPFLQSGQLSGIRLSTRPDAIDGGTLSRLLRFGVDTVELGAQAMDDGVLRLSGRGHTASDTERASELIKSYGFRLVLQMMTGLPGSDRERDLETARRIIALGPDAVRIYPTVIIKGTELYDLWCAGDYAEHTVEDAVSLCAELLPMFGRAGISVIRLGLNPTDELSGGVAAAGAYHPALGELVKSRILLERARALLPPLRGKSAALHVHPFDTSAMAGFRRRSTETLMTEFDLKALKIIGDGCEKGKITITEIAK